jgi:uncharacterized RDD family membrane protein YckC
MTSTLNIRTPEGVTFSLPLAGPVSRAVAIGIDFLLILALTWIATRLVQLVAIVSPQWAAALPSLVYFVIQSAYGMVLEGVWRGQTVGKRVVGIRVVDDRGLALRPAQVVVRNVLRLVDSLPVFYLVGGVSMVVTRHNQRLGDLAAGTVVVRRTLEHEPRIEGLLAGQYNSFREHPLIEARLRQRTTPELAALALGALMRRDDLNPPDRLKVYARLADHFREICPFPEVVIAGLSDEQYLRNVVESVYRRRAS